MLSKNQIGMENKYDFGVDVWSVGVLAYELSWGKPPFESDDQKATYNRIWNISFSFPIQFSSELKDFLSRILIKDPKKRMSLDSMLQHPWITKHYSEAARSMQQTQPDQL